MKLEQQVASLELCKKLKELGVRQASYFKWVNTQPENWMRGKDELNPNAKYEWVLEKGMSSNQAFTVNPEVYSAFTVAELGEMLPLEISSRKGKRGWACNWSGGGRHGISTTKDTEADARAKMLIYLLENKLI